VYKKLIEPDIATLPKSIDEGLEMMCQKPKIAYVASDVFMRLAQSRRACSVVPVERASYMLTESLVISKKSPYKRIFSSKYVNISPSDIQSINRSSQSINRSTIPSIYLSVSLTIHVSYYGALFITVCVKHD
jgi:hypothetical protein